MVRSMYAIRSTAATNVVNSSGKVMKNSTVKTSDGVKFKTSSSGSLSTADDDNDVSSYFTEPEEPNCTED